MTVTVKAVQVSLLATDRANTVTRRVADDAQIAFNYSAYGERQQECAAHSESAFNGQHLERSGAYLLGNGYRAYLPSLRRFNAPDTLSPFAAGGLNSYAYCRGEPVNRSDPSGHSDNAWSYAMIGLGLFAFAGGLGMAVARPRLQGLGLGIAAGGVLAAGVASMGIGPINKDFTRTLNIAAAVFLVGGAAGGAILGKIMSKSRSTVSQLPVIPDQFWRNPMAARVKTNPVGSPALSLRSPPHVQPTTSPSGSATGNFASKVSSNATSVRTNSQPSSPALSVRSASEGAASSTVPAIPTTPAAQQKFGAIKPVTWSRLPRRSIEEYNPMALTKTTLLGKGVRV